jgi:hypothetical protein
MVEAPMTTNLKTPNKVVIFRACKYISLKNSLGGKPAALHWSWGQKMLLPFCAFPKVKVKAALSCQTDHIRQRPQYAPPFDVGYSEVVSRLFFQETIASFGKSKHRRQVQKWLCTAELKGFSPSFAWWFLPLTWRSQPLAPPKMWWFLSPLLLDMESNESARACVWLPKACEISSVIFW